MRRSKSLPYVVPNILALTACGGGGGDGVANLPPPPPPPPSSAPAPPAPTVTVKSAPLPSTPALTTGSFDAVAIVETQTQKGLAYRSANPGEVRITVDSAKKSYTVVAPAGGESWDTEIPILSPDFGQHVETTTIASDGSSETVKEDVTQGLGGVTIGTAPADVQQFSIVSNVGLRHVSYGSWAYVLLGTRSDSTMYAKEGPTVVYFAYGDRTPPSDIPASGIARYAIHVSRLPADYGWTKDRLTLPLSDLSLTADFGARSISALFDAPPQLLTDTDNGTTFYSIGVYAAGMAAFSAAGDFAIPLSGTMTERPTDPKLTDTITPLSGAVNGAFFGPQASEIGGVFTLATPDGRGAAGAFGGARQ